VIGTSDLYESKAQKEFQMQIYEELMKDHRKVMDLFNQLISQADATAEVRNGLIDQIRDELIPHSRAEEAVFYNSLREIPEVKGLVMHGYAEHMEAETLLRTLQVTGKVDAGWRTVAEKLRDALAHHIEEEETEIFDAAKQVLAAEEAEMIGKAFVEMKPEIREQGLMGTTVDMVANLMPQRFVNSLRNFVSSKH
jgi:hemerythrin-like domain-containing protein